MATATKPRADVGTVHLTSPAEAEFYAASVRYFVAPGRRKPSLVTKSGEVRPARAERIEEEIANLPWGRI